MNDLLEIFNKLKAITSNKDKEELLKQNKDNSYLANLLYLNLNPYGRFYIKTIPEYTKSRPPWINGPAAYKEFIQLTNKLQNRELTGNAAKEAVKVFMAHTIESEATIYKSILLKEAIGVGTKTVNKVWPNLVPSFEVMLAPNEIPNILNIRYPLYVQPKYDGFRCVYLPLGGSESFFSRSGKPFGNQELIEHFSALQGITSYVLDGELYSHKRSFNEIVAILTTETAQIPNDIKYIVYDCVPIEDWKAQNCNLTYEYRLKLLRTVITGSVADYAKVIDVPTDIVETPLAVKNLYETYLQKGYEGVMLKSVEGKYKWKRCTINSGEMLKLKPFETLDLKVTGTYAGEGQFTGLAGGLIVDYNTNAVRVGSGFTLENRKDIKENSNKYIGKTVEIKYQEVTEDNSLRFPTFIRLREDK